MPVTCRAASHMDVYCTWMQVATIAGCCRPSLLQFILHECMNAYRLGRVSCDETCWALLKSDSPKIRYILLTSQQVQQVGWNQCFVAHTSQICDTTEAMVQLFELRQPGGCGCQDLWTDTRWVPKKRDAWIDGTSIQGIITEKRLGLSNCWNNLDKSKLWETNLTSDISDIKHIIRWHLICSFLWSVSFYLSWLTVVVCTALQPKQTQPCCSNARNWQRHPWQETNAFAHHEAATYRAFLADSGLAMTNVLLPHACVHYPG